MKKITIYLLVILVASQIQAQVCPQTQSSIDLRGNNISARISNNGTLFTDGNEAQFIPNYALGLNQPGTIFSAGLWLGGINANSNLQVAAADYVQLNKYDFTAGPLSPEGTTSNFDCSNWDRHFIAQKSTIDAFRAALPLTPATAIAQFPGIMGWPGRGNTYFNAVYAFDLPQNASGLAPFVDSDGNGIYDPLSGDYPAVLLQGKDPFVPTEMVWCVFNDQNAGAVHSNSQGDIFKVEIQLTAWSFACDQDQILNNTVFTSHKIINRGLEYTDSMYVGMWVDFDLGCYTDDYIGSNPALNTMFAYNADAVDGTNGNSCFGVPTFGSTPPVQSVRFLNKPLSKFIYLNGDGLPGGQADAGPVARFNAISGSWPDGAPLTTAPTGYGPGTPISHAYPGDPADPNSNSLCNVNAPPQDRRVLGSTFIGRLQPGQVEELTIAWATHFDVQGPCNLGSTFEDVTAIQAAYIDGFSSECLMVNAPDLPETLIGLFPNPTTADFTLQYGQEKPLAINIYDLNGQLVLEQHAGFGAQGTVVRTTNLNSGIYAVQIQTARGMIVKKLVIAR